MLLPAQTLGFVRGAFVSCGGQQRSPGGGVKVLGALDDHQVCRCVDAPRQRACRYQHLKCSTAALRSHATISHTWNTWAPLKAAKHWQEKLSSAPQQSAKAYRLWCAPGSCRPRRALPRTCGRCRPGPRGAAQCQTAACAALTHPVHTYETLTRWQPGIATQHATCCACLQLLLTRLVLPC